VCQEYQILLPNKLNVEISWTWVIAFIALTYISGAPTLFKHMVKQRTKQLSKYNETHTKAA
jgi:hypothetical protein